MCFTVGFTCISDTHTPPLASNFRADDANIAPSGDRTQPKVARGHKGNAATFWLNSSLRGSSQAVTGKDGCQH